MSGTTYYSRTQSQWLMLDCVLEILIHCLIFISYHMLRRDSFLRLENHFKILP